jgi:hypothetical protein
MQWSGPTVVLASGLLGACLPSYSFNAAADAGQDVAAADVQGADVTAEASPDAGGSDASDATSGDSGAGDTGGAEGSSTGITLDVGFPKTAQISDGAGMTLATTFDVPGGGRMLVAVVVWGQYGGAGVWPVSFASPDLTWTSGIQSVSSPMYADAVGVGVWTAWSPGGLTAETVTATRSNDVSADAVLAVYSLAGASQTVGATGGDVGFSGSAAPLSVTLTAQAAGSFVVGGLLDGNGNTGVRGMTRPDTVYDTTLASGSGNGIAIGHLIGGTSGPGTVTIGQDSAFENDVTAGVEILHR